MERTKLFINAEVITVDEKDRIVEAVAVQGNKIMAVGSNEEILKLKDISSKVIDLKGKTLIPGFIDSHLHISIYGSNCISISCKDKDMKSIQDLLQAVKDRAIQTPKGQWIRAWGYNEDNFLEKRFPTKEELDHITTDHPIMITRTCSHISMVNSLALEIANIDRSTPDPAGGKIVRTEMGEPSGLLIENAHMRMFDIAAFSEEELSQAHEIASRHFTEKGITSIHDATGYGMDNLRLLQSDSERGIIKQRVYAMVGALNDSRSVVEHMTETGIYSGLGDEKFKIGPVKLFLDGSSSGPTVWTRAPYSSDPDNYGIHYFSQEEVDRLLIPAHKKGWQITAHAQGDAAIDMFLNTVEKANRLFPRKDARHRIEHAGIAAPDLIERMKELKVVPVPNPAFLYEYGDGYVQNYGGRASWMYPMGDYQNAGIPAAMASDSPVTDFNPMRGIHSAMVRKSNSGQVIGERNRVSLLQAIRMYTYNGAYASFEEDKKGSIEAGKLADLVLLDRSLLRANVEEIPEVKVEWTMIDGEIVFTKSNGENFTDFILGY